MVSPRWLRLVRDLRAAPGRTALLVVAVAAALAVVGTVLGSRAILVREIGRSYLSTRPASATLVLDRPVDEALLTSLRAEPGVVEADAREVVGARVQVNGDWRPLLLFAADDLPTMRLNTVALESGAWPAVAQIAVERSALEGLGAGPGDRVTVKTPHGPPTDLVVAGVVHDPGLAPAPMERTTYGYVDRDTLALLGEGADLHELRVRFDTVDRAAIEARSEALAAELGGVEEIRVPPPDLHPHQRQMETLTAMMLGFALLGLVLAGVVVSNALSALLARQLREIGVLKTLGARRSAIVAWYTALAAGIGAAALVVALPLGAIGAEGQAAMVAGVLNFDLADRAIPWPVLASLTAFGVGVPVVLALPPVLGASRVPVLAATARHGAAPESLRRWIVRLPRPAREAARRPRRLLSLLVLLSAGGALFLAALDVRASWRAMVDSMHTTRRYDAEIRFVLPEPVDVVDLVARVDGVRAVEAWGGATAAVARPDGVPLTRTWPDRVHGSFVALAPPVDTALVELPLQEGRRLAVDDADGVVLNHAARPLVPGVAVGDTVHLVVDHHPADLRVVGIVEEVGAPAAAYLTPATYERVTGEGTRWIRVVADPDAIPRIVAALDAERSGDLPSARSETGPATARAGRPVAKSRGSGAGRPVDRESRPRSVGGRAVSLVLPAVELTDAVSEHVGILVDTLLALAAGLGAVGAIGLGSAMATSVLERAREIAVRKTLGARPARIARDLVAEAVTVAVASWVVAVAASVPLAAAMDAAIGRLGFLAPLPFVVAPGPIALWLALVVAGAVLATAIPARSAGRLPVVEGLAGAQ